MAQKTRERFENTRPKPNHSKNGKVTFATTTTESDDDGNDVAVPSTTDVTGLVENSYFEVGDAGSSFSGTDSYGNPIKAITYSKRMPNMSRFDLATAVNDANGDFDASSVLSRQYLYSQGIKGFGENEQIPKFELESKPNDTYEEQYFQHVFNWPTAHTIKPRKIAGLVEESVSCTAADDVDDDGNPIPGTGATTTTYTQHEHAATFTADLTLTGVDSEIYWIVPHSSKTDGTANWVYEPVVFDSLGRVQGGNGEVTPSFDNSGKLNVTGTGSSLGTFTLEWDDDPNAFGLAIETVEFGGQIWIRDGGGEVGNTTKNVLLEAGQTYDVKLNGNSGGYTVSGNKIILKDKDGNDTNATFKIDSVSNNVSEKIGSPIIYHGGTDDNCIFFNYVESQGGNSSSVVASILHDFNDQLNQDISITSSVGTVTVESKSKADEGASNFKKGRKHYLITFGNKKVTSARDVSVTLDSNLTASGVTSNPQLAKVKVESENSIRVWFETENGNNTFARAFTVTLEGLDQGTTDLVAIGDTVNGATITNVVNYVVATGLRRSVSQFSTPGRVDRKVSEARFISLGYTTSDYSNAQSWVRLDDVNDIERRMKIGGLGLEEGTRVVAVDPTNRIVWLNQRIKSSDLKSILVINDEVNRISKHTLCYATISGGSFTADSTHTTDKGVQIVVRAGKGIINRSAVVGTYFSFDKKSVTYQPVFYSADPFCEKYVLEEESGDYTLGSILWNDGSKSTGQFLLTRPETQDAYKIASIYLSFTNAPLDIDLYETFREVYELSGKNIIALYNFINSYVQTTLNGKKAVLIEDDVCRDQIDLEYFQSYDPFLEAEDINIALQSIDAGVSDICVDENEILNPTESPSNTLDDIKDRFGEIVSKSLSQSSILSEEYYKKLITNEDSLFNRIQKGANTVRESIPKQRVSNLPPQIEGEDSSGTIFKKSNFRDIPPAMDRVKFFTSDLQFADNRGFDPTIDLDPTTTYNQPTFVFRSKPKWTTTAPDQTVFPFTGPNHTTNIKVNITKDADGYVETITSTNDPVTVVATATCDDGDATVTADWATPTIGTDIQFYDRTAWPNNYTIGTNWFLPPELRDLNHLEKPDGHSSLSVPTAVVHPQNIWLPNVNYQMDHYKMFHFRMNELAEMIGETILNKGNAFIDEPLLAKLTDELKRGDNTIKVASTAGFFSSGYLIIPKYTKKILINETGNYNSIFSYSGEEIIYYGSKTATSFDNCQRGCFGTSPGFQSGITAGEMKKGVQYKIEKLGNTVWEKAAGLDAAKIGDVFEAQKPNWFKGTGLVSIFGSSAEPTPVIGSPPAITSYERGFSLAQYTVFSLREI